MKWIGQHIWSFISRFRNDVYLEDISDAGSDTDKFLVAESDGKIAYRTGAEVLSDIGASAESSDLEISNASDNRVVTSSGGTDLNAEENFTFDGTTLNITGKTDISPGGSVGGAALTIDNDDVDQVALDIDAENTTANIIDIDAQDLTTGSAIHIDGGTAGTKSFIELDLDLPCIVHNEYTQGLLVDLEKTGNVATGDINYVHGLDVRFNDAGTNVGSSVFRGLYLVCVDQNDAGNNSRYGIHLNLTGGDPTSTYGLRTKVENGGYDLYMESSDTYADYCKVSTGVAGATTIITNDNGAGGGSGTDADLHLNIDGDIILDPHTGEDIFFKENGTERFQFHLDSTPTMEVTGNFDIDGSGDIALSPTGSLDVVSNEVNFTSSTSSKPILKIQNDTNDASGPTLTLKNNRDGNGLEDGDYLGHVLFQGEDAAGNFENYGSISGSVEEADDGDEAGQIAIKVANDGTVRNGITMTGDKATAEEVNVTIANGAASVTTVAGTLTMGTTAFVNNSGVVQVATQGTIDHDSLANFVANEHIDWTGDVSASSVIHTNNITDLHGAGVNGSANQLLTDDGDGSVTSESGATWDGDIFKLTSSTNNRPRLDIETTATGNKPPVLQFISDRGENAQDGDFIGDIKTQSDNDNQSALVDYTIIRSKIIDASAGSETGGIDFMTRNNGTTASTVMSLLGTGAQVHGDFEVNGDTATFQSSNADDPLVELQNRTNDGSSPTLKFNNTRGGNNGANNDFAGIIDFYAVDNGSNSHQYGQINCRAQDATDSAEAGTMNFYVANYNGSLGLGLQLRGGDASGEVDAIVGLGAESQTTISGDLRVTGDNMTSAGAMTFTPVGKYTITAPDLTGDVFHLDADADTDNIVNIDAGVLDIDASGQVDITTGQGDITISSANDGTLTAAGDNMIVSTTTAAGLLTLSSAHTAGQAIHIDGNAHADSEVDIDAGILDINVTGVTTLDTTQFTITGKTKIPNRTFALPSDGAGNADGDVIYIGTNTGGTATVAGKIYYYASTGLWVLTNSDDPSTATGLLAVALGTDPDADGMLLRGTVDLAGNIVGTEALGSILYLDKATAGDATTAAPTATGDIVRVIGYALTTGDTNKIWFNPDNTWVEHV